MHATTEGTVETLTQFRSETRAWLEANAPRPDDPEAWAHEHG